jgi:hypothetical protein
VLEEEVSKEEVLEEEAASDVEILKEEAEVQVAAFVEVEVVVKHYSTNIVNLDTILYVN